jgi:hypothetical protein
MKPEKETIPANQIFPTSRAQYYLTSRSWRSNDGDKLRSLLQSLDYTSGLSWLMQPEPPATPSVAEDTSIKKILVISREAPDAFFEAVQVTPQLSNSIEEMTRGQSNNPNWHKVREHRFTASVFNDIIKAKSLSVTLKAS